MFLLFAFQLYPLSAFACTRIYRILCRRTLTIISGGHSTSPEVVVEKKKLRKSREKKKAKKEHQKKDSSSESYKEEDYSRSDGKLEKRQNISKSLESFSRDACPEYRRVYTQQREKQGEVRISERSKWGSGRRNEFSEERDRDRSGRKDRFGDNHERGHRKRDRS